MSPDGPVIEVGEDVFIALFALAGFLISADGYVVTNNHVIQPDGRAELEEVTVTLVDGTEYQAQVVGRDPASDLAVLKISRRDMPSFALAQAPQLRRGEEAGPRRFPEAPARLLR